MNDPDKLTRFIHDLGKKASLIDSTKSTSKNVLRDGKGIKKKRKSSCNIVDHEIVPFSGPKILSFADNISNILHFFTHNFLNVGRKGGVRNRKIREEGR